VAYDAITSLGVDHLGHREALRPLLRTAVWIYLVDLLLFPIGLAVAIAADGRLAPVAVTAPLCVLLALFAGERRHRLDALELSRAYRGTALLLGDVVESDDQYTGRHSRAVVDLALAVGARLGLDEPGARRLEFGALLHDIGKIAVPKAILHKPGPLDPDEWVAMRRHTIDGQRMLEGVGGSWRRQGRWCAALMSGGTAAGTPMAWPETGSRSKPGSARRATPSAL
jgi:HD-GYP domain-containing protein (c-di-GMP phosphodiesterase class II)